MHPRVCRESRAEALRFKSFHLHAEPTGTGVAMETGFEFMKRMQEDAEFRRKVNACREGEERFAFLKSEGYDFTPFVQLMKNLSSGQQSAGWLGQPGESASPRQSASGFLGRLGQIFHIPKAPA
jgi:predicted ribosomally synthesized peptide with nif11-like leader